MNNVLAFVFDTLVVNQIICEKSDDYIRVSRDSMVNASYARDLAEEEAYEMTLQFLRLEFPDIGLHWSGKDDSWFYLSPLR